VGQSRCSWSALRSCKRQCSGKNPFSKIFIRRGRCSSSTSSAWRERPVHLLLRRALLPNSVHQLKLLSDRLVLYIAQAAECRERINASEHEVRHLHETLTATQQNNEQHASTIAQLQAQLEEEQVHRSATEGAIKKNSTRNTTSPPLLSPVTRFCLRDVQVQKQTQSHKICNARAKRGERFQKLFGGIWI
jgi:septal ring factor EnvC (AmiA/AmiB activator)